MSIQYSWRNAATRSRTSTTLEYCECRSFSTRLSSSSTKRTAARAYPRKTAAHSNSFGVPMNFVTIPGSPERAERQGNFSCASIRSGGLCDSLLSFATELQSFYHDCVLCPNSPYLSMSCGACSAVIAIFRNCHSRGSSSLPSTEPKALSASRTHDKGHQRLGQPTQVLLSMLLKSSMSASATLISLATSTLVLHASHSGDLAAKMVS